MGKSLRARKGEGVGGAKAMSQTKQHRGKGQRKGTGKTSPEESAATERVGAIPFYSQYYGHPLQDLERIIQGIRQGGRNILWLAGDSSLDNKHWLYEGDKASADLSLSPFADAINGYERLLNPPRMVQDVAYWVNALLQQSQPELACVNAALEESTIADRAGHSLTGHDQVIRDNLQESDVIVVSVGGNDVALKPSPNTQMQIMQLVTAPEGSEPFAQAMAYFVNMLKDQVEGYVQSLVGKTKPRAVVACMYYFFDEKPGNGWAEPTLSALGYNQEPDILQRLIRTVYKLATCNIFVEGIKVIPLPLFEYLDGKDTNDYKSRVEPSVSGGQKMAAAITKAISAP